MDLIQDLLGRQLGREALGEEEVKLTKRFYGWPEDAKFLIPDGVFEHFQKGIGARGKAEHARWTSIQTEYRTAHADLANEMKLMQYRELPKGWDKDVPVFPADAKGLATRDSSGTCPTGGSRDAWPGGAVEGLSRARYMAPRCHRSAEIPSRRRPRVLERE